MMGGDEMEIYPHVATGTNGLGVVSPLAPLEDALQYPTTNTQYPMDKEIR